MTHTLCQRLLVVAAFLALPAQATDELPKRKPGLWEITSELSMMPGRAMTMHQCIDANTDADLLARTAEERKNCSQQRIWREDGKYRIEAVCKAQGSTVSSTGLFSGDFSGAYSGNIVSRFEPPRNGMSESRMKISARHLGACKAGQKPGDSTLSMPGMGNIDLDKLIKGMPRMPSAQ